MTTGTILDVLDAQQPTPWWRPRKRPTALQLAVADLEECRRDQLNHKRLAEYHKAMADMLKDREKRLTADIKRLSEDNENPT